MLDSKKQIRKNLIWNSAGTLFYMGSQWLITVLVVRLSGDYSSAGILTLAMSIAAPLTMLAMMNLRTFQVANMDARFSDGDFIFARIITSLMSLGICAVVTAGGRYSLYVWSCILLFMIFRLSEAIVDVLHGIDQRAWRLDLVGKSFFMRGILILALFTVGELLFKSLPVSILLMELGVYGVIVCYDISSCKKCTRLNLVRNKGSFISLMKIGIPLGAFSFLLTLISSIPRLFLERWHGEDILGVFGSITTVTLLIPQLASFIFNPLIPVFAERWKSNDKRGFRRLLSLSVTAIAAIGTVTLLGAYFFGEWGLSVVFGDSIRPYSYLLCPVLGTAILTAYIGLLGTILTVLSDYSALVWLSLISAVGCLIASVLLIQKSALVGTILATAVGLGMECFLLGTRTVVLLKRTDA